MVLEASSERTSDLQEPMEFWMLVSEMSSLWMLGPAVASSLLCILTMCSMVRLSLLFFSGRLTSAVFSLQILLLSEAAATWLEVEAVAASGTCIIAVVTPMLQDEVATLILREEARKLQVDFLLTVALEVPGPRINIATGTKSSYGNNRLSGVLLSITSALIALIPVSGITFSWDCPAGVFQGGFPMKERGGELLCEQLLPHAS